MAIRREAADLVGQAQTAVSTAHADCQVHGPQEAYDYLLPNLGLLRQAGNPSLLEIGLTNLGELCRLAGKLDDATKWFQEALGISADTAELHGLGYVLDNLGRIHLESGRLDEAIASLSQAYRVQLADGYLMGQAQALRYLGQAQRSAGQPDQATESFKAALALFKDLKAVVEADEVRSALTDLRRHADPTR
jgi:tetratricopeptide (TPR) repeat protein